jgi:hypothetical protein
MFVDEEKDTIYVYLVHGQPSDIAELDHAMTDVLGAGRPPQHHLEALTGQYTFLELKDWFDQIAPQVLDIPGTVLVNIDLVKNRLRVGVETPAVASAVEAELAALGIPRDAVNMEEMALVEDDPPPALPEESPGLAPGEKTLQSEIRPLVGGIRIQKDRPSKPNLGHCTLALYAELKGNDGFVTASHCANVRGGWDEKRPATIFSQPDNPVEIGKEAVNPLFNDKLPGCPKKGPKDKEDRKCRYSDSLWAQLEKKVPFCKGFIARPKLNKGIEWNGQDYFRITGKKGLVFPKMDVEGVGQATGLMQGRVTQVGALVRLKGGRALLDQAEANYKHAKGDSGAAIFTPDGPDASLVAIVGIHSGNVKETDTDKEEVVDVFSPINNVERELGALIISIGSLEDKCVQNKK